MDALFFDYDGTLCVDGSVPQENREAIEYVQSLGHLVFLNTGRSRGFVPDAVLNSVRFDGLCCGCVYCSIGNEVLFNREMPVSEVASICRRAAKKDVPLHLEGTYDSYTYVGDRDIPENPFGIGNNIRDMGGMEAFLQSDAARHIAKISVILPRLPEGFTMPELAQIDMNGFVEGVPHGFTKATPMKAILDRFGIDKAHTAAFGDSLNDEHMLAFVGHPVVMHPAPSQLDIYHPLRVSSVAEGIYALYPKK